VSGSTGPAGREKNPWRSGEPKGVYGKKDHERDEIGFEKCFHDAPPVPDTFILSGNAAALYYDKNL